jgi:hypothetical protein
MTYYGLNPSFCDASSRLPLFADAVRRGRAFQVFREDGTPTPELSSIGPDELPIEDGRHHGLRLFDDMGGTMPLLHGVTLGGLTLKQRPGEAAVLYGRRWTGLERVIVRGGVAAGWHVPSLDALGSLRPRVLRTLDWQRTNLRTHWDARWPLELYGVEMPLKKQCEAANLLSCALWWCAPPRYELPVEDYEAWLEAALQVIQETAKRPPILEYGNEIWNAAFPVHGWLQEHVGPPSWHEIAAQEIAILKRVADRVFGPPGLLGARTYYLFVGGQLTVPSHMDRILSALTDLGVTPDLAGPALYVTPLRANKEEWEATGAVPTQDELRASCFARLKEIERLDPRGPLEQHDEIRQCYNVDYFACYEAGQSLIAGAHPWRRAAIEAQSTEWMGDLYREIRRVAESAGVDLLNWYSAASSQEPTDSRVDVFGLLEGIGKPLLSKALAARGD